MNATLKTIAITLSLFSGLIATGSQAMAQAVISIPGLGTKDLTSTTGDYQLSTSGPAFVSNLGDTGNSRPSLTVPLDNGLGSNLQNSSGWAFSGAQGDTWIADLDLGDPKVVYSVAFENTTSSVQTYSVSFSVPISPAEAFTPADVRATVAGSLLSGGDTAAVLTPLLSSTTGGSGTFLETSTLSLAPGPGVNSTNVDLSTGVVTAPGDGGDVTFLAQTPGYNLYNANGPSGTYDALNVNLSFTLSAGDYASFTGRVDVLPVTSAAPEPSSMALILAGLGLLVFIRRLRMV